MSFISRLRRSYRRAQIAKSNKLPLKLGRSTPSIELLETRIVPTKWSGDIFDGLGGSSGPLFTNDQVQEIVGNVHVPAGKTLTIEAGTVVKFDNNFSLNVDIRSQLLPGDTGQDDHHHLRQSSTLPRVAAILPPTATGAILPSAATVWATR